MKTCNGGEDTCGIILHEVVIGRWDIHCGCVPVKLLELGWETRVSPHLYNWFYGESLDKLLICFFIDRGPGIVMVWDGKSSLFLYLKQQFPIGFLAVERRT